jgi:hypothetical protein
VDQLSSQLMTTPRIDVRIMYENQLGKELAESLFASFQKAGWKEVKLSPGGGLGLGISVGHGPVVEPVRTAIERSTKLRVRLSDPAQPGASGSMFVAVGINAI